VMDDRAWNMDREARISLANRIPAFIDRQVTVQQNHLIKLPFSTHVTTKAICCPILNPNEFLPSKGLK
jgi:DNA primase catalytic subunit